MFCKNLIILFFITLFCTALADANAAELSGAYSCTLNLLHQEWHQNLIPHIPNPCIVEKISYDSDSWFEKDEFYYLFDVPLNKQISVDDITRACTFLKLKNKFEQINLTFLPLEKGYHLHVNLVSFWTFKSVKLKGPLIGKDAYKQYYQLETGDQFDIKKHTYSLEKIIEACKQEGYLNACITDSFDYQKNTKSIVVYLSLNLGDKFTVDQVVVNIDVPDKEKIFELNNKLKTNFRKALKGKYYTQTIVNKETQRLKLYLTKKGYFNPIINLKEDIHYSSAKIDLHLTVILSQKKVITFFGNRFFSKDQLLQDICAFGHSTALIPNALLAQEIIQAYFKKGFWHVKIDFKEDDKNIFFIINEGPRATINQVDFVGCSADNMTLRSFFLPLLKSNFFDGDILKKSLDELIAWYQKEGYWDCAIINQEYSYLPDTSYALKLTIFEGNRRFINSATVKNFPELNNEPPFNKFNAMMPIACDMQEINHQRQWLLQYFQQQGYLYVQLKPEIREQNNHIDIIWHISGIESKVHFGKTILLGSSTFPFKNILRELVYKQGDLWKKDKLELSVSQLRDLLIFETVYLYPHKLDNTVYEKPLMLKLLEDDPYEVRFRGGFQQVSHNLTFRSGSTYKIGGSFLYKNVTNEADIFRIDGDLTRFTRYFTIIYQRPWIFNNPIGCIFKAYDSKYKQPIFIGSDKTLYQAIQQGFLCGLSRQWTQTSFGTNFGFEWLETNDLSLQIAQAINFESKLIDKKIPYFFCEPTLLVDTLDDQLNPSMGLLTIISCKAMVPLQRNIVSFFKVLAEQSFFFPAKWCVFGFRLRFGHIFNQDFEEIMPPERFYLGGQSSIRSYQPNFAPPLGIFIDEDGKEQLAPQGGKSMVNANFEIRFNPVWNIGLVVFQDFGTLIEKSFTEIVGSRFLTATGFGLRYNTPVGPLRFDIGWKWKRFNPLESAFAWFITLGQAF